MASAAVDVKAPVSEWAVDDAAMFRVEGESARWRFPFTVLDPTPGGKNLGRIEWHLELLPKYATKKRAARLAGMVLYATQTRDERYHRRLFLLPCDSEGLVSYRSNTRDDFTRFVWRTGFCSEHRAPVLTAYPENHHVALIVRLESSISGDVYFERGVNGCSPS